MDEITVIDRELHTLQQNRHAVQLLLDELEYRHSPEGNRRKGDRRAGLNRRESTQAEDAAFMALRRIEDKDLVEPQDRRQPREVRFQALRTRIDSLDQNRSVLLTRREELLQSEATKPLSLTIQLSPQVAQHLRSAAGANGQELQEYVSALLERTAQAGAHPDAQSRRGPAEDKSSPAGPKGARRGKRGG